MTRRFATTSAANEPAAGLDVTWRALLFDADGNPNDPADPSQALLATTDALVDGLRAHFALVPERARRHWLEDTLGIAALPMLPDEVVAVATAEPEAVPAVLARGTELRAAKGGGVPERTYATTDALTVLGATFAGVHGYLADGLDDWTSFSPDVATAFAPFATTAPAEHRIDFVTDAITFAGGDGTVTLRLQGEGVASLKGARWWYSTADGLREAGVGISGNDVTLTLNGGCAPCDLDGEQHAYLRVSILGDRMTRKRYDLTFDRAEVSLYREEVPADGAYYNDGALDVTKEFKPFGPVPQRGDAFYVRCDEAFSRRLSALYVDVTLADEEPNIGGGQAQPPSAEDTLTVEDLFDAAITVYLRLYDVEPENIEELKEQIGGPVKARIRGVVGEAPRLSTVYDKAEAVGRVAADLFRVTAVAKSLDDAYTTVHEAWEQMVRVTPPGFKPPPEPPKPPSGDEVARAIRDNITALVGQYSSGGSSGPGERTSDPGPVLVWEHRPEGAWKAITRAAPGLDLDSERQGVPAVITASRLTEVAGTPGHYVRLRIAQGDFGWQAHLDAIAQFAAAAASGGTPSADLLKPPPPKVAKSVSVTYATVPTQVTDIRTRNAPATGPASPGDHLPFWQPVSGEDGRAGSVTFGFDIAEALLGSTFAWYAHVAQASACESAGLDHKAVWQYWSTDGTWVDVDTLDGTRGLRQSGLVRFVTPRDWAGDCLDVSAESGRWLRLRTSTPDFVGDLLAVHADAMTARYQAPGAPDDLAPLTPLVPEQVKGLRTPVPGVKVTNPVAGIPGRAREDDERYRARAGSVVRHRNRAIQAWDYETLVTTEFPEVAVARCLPHADATHCSVAGSVGIVVLPRSTERMPYPSVALADRIAVALRGRLPVHAKVVVLCPEYVAIRFHAAVVLRRGVAAAEARVRILDAVERRLHPLSGTEGAPFGLALYPSSLLAFLETLPDVDHVTSFRLLPPLPPDEVVEVDPCRGLIASGGDHDLRLEEQL